MPSLRLSTIFASALLVAATLAAFGLPASAQTLNPATGNNGLIRQNDLQNLQNRVQRQQYQQQQQQYRAQDRQIIPQPRPVMPQLKPGATCQTQIIGTTPVSNCR